MLGHSYGVLCGWLAFSSGDVGTAGVLFLLYLAGAAFLD